MKGISIAGRKAKGRRCQQFVRDVVQADLSLLPGDIESTPMGVSGPDLRRSPIARVRFPFVVNCKYDENKSVWHCWESGNKIKPDVATDMPLLVMMKNFHDPLAIMDFRQWMSIVSELDKLKYPQYQNKEILNVS